MRKIFARILVAVAVAGLLAASATAAIAQDGTCPVGKTGA